MWSPLWRVLIINRIPKHAASSSNPVGTAMTMASTAGGNESPVRRFFSSLRSELEDSSFLQNVGTLWRTSQHLLTCSMLWSDGLEHPSSCSCDVETNVNSRKTTCVKIRILNIIVERLFLVRLIMGFDFLGVNFGNCSNSIEGVLFACTEPI